MWTMKKCIKTTTDVYLTLFQVRLQPLEPWITKYDIIAMKQTC